jgi:NAD-dependent dihydropyrimidine dehydrogenase PreA subunit
MLFHRFNGRPWVIGATVFYTLYSTSCHRSYFFVCRDRASIESDALQSAKRHIHKLAVIQKVCRIVGMCPADDMEQIHKNKLHGKLLLEDFRYCRTLAYRRWEKAKLTTKA